MWPTGPLVEVRVRILEEILVWGIYYKLHMIVILIGNLRGFEISEEM